MITMPEVKAKAAAIQDSTVLEVVIYKIKPDYADSFKDILTEARTTIQTLPGLMEYQTFQSAGNELLFVDLARWESLYAAKSAAKQVEHMQELAHFMAVFEEIIVMDHFEPFAKSERGIRQEDYFNASPEPELVELPAYNYLSVKGIGAPENRRFLNAIEAIYAVAYNLKFSNQAPAQDFLNIMEGQWWVESGLPFDQTPRDEWHWNILIRLPENITTEHVDLAVQEVVKTKGIMLASEIEFSTIEAGKFVQALHTGSYEAEGPLIARIMQFVEEKGLQVNGHHHEVYITDPQKVEVEKLKTIIRYAVE